MRTTAKPDQREGHGGQHLARHRADEDAQGDGEQRVADRGDAGHVEEEDVEPGLLTDVRQRPDPPGHPQPVDRRRRRPPPCPTRPNLTRAQRRRLMPWVQTRRWVPCSTSRATSGAPQNRPTSSGRIRNRMPSDSQGLYWLVNWFSELWQPFRNACRPDVRTDLRRRRRQPLVRVGVVHRDPARDHQRGQDDQRDRGEQRLLAVLSPGEPDHAVTPQASWLPWVSPSAR